MLFKTEQNETKKTKPCKAADWEEENKKGKQTRNIYLKIHRCNQKG